MIHRSGVVSGKRMYELLLGPPLPADATDLEYQISSHDVWRPGVYDSERAARYAFGFSDAELQVLQDRANANGGGQGGVITFEMLKRARRADRSISSD